MRNKISWLFMLLPFFIGSSICNAKEVKLGTYTTFVGENYKKKTGPQGEGTLVMKTNALYRTRNGESYPVMYDVLKGVFQDSHVTEATLQFNSGWVFKGTVDYYFEQSSPTKDKVTYILRNGTIESDNIQFKTKVKLAFNDKDSFIVVREIDEKSFSVQTSKFNLSFQAQNGDMIQGYRVLNVFGKNCKRIENYMIKSTTRYLSNPNYYHDRYKDKWQLVQLGHSFCDATGRKITIDKKQGTDIIRRGEKEYVEFNSKRILRALLVYNDALFQFKDSVAKINYRDKSSFEGHVYSKYLNNDGDFRNVNEMLTSLLGNLSFTNTDISPFTGKQFKEGDSHIIEWKYGHKIDDIKKELFTGNWVVSVGNYGSFNNLKEEGEINVKSDGTYTWISENWSYGNVTKYKTASREGKWNVNKNDFVLEPNPNATVYTQKVYPSTSISNITYNQLSQMNEEAMAEARQEQAKVRKSEELRPYNFDVVEFNNNEIKLFIGEFSYLLKKKTTKKTVITSSQIVGRWGTDNDIVFDFNENGTYTQYITNKITKWEWVEVYSVAISGKWSYDGNYLIAYSNPSLSAVQIRLESISTQVSRARVLARQNELKQIAIESQANHRKNDTPRTTIAKITRWDENSFRCRDTNNNETFFLRLK